MSEDRPYYAMLRTSKGNEHSYRVKPEKLDDYFQLIHYATGVPRADAVSKLRDGAILRGLGWSFRQASDLPARRFGPSR